MGENNILYYKKIVRIFYHTQFCPLIDNDLTYLNQQLELVLHNVDDDSEEVLMSNDTFVSELLEI